MARSAWDLQSASATSNMCRRFYAAICENPWVAERGVINIMEVAGRKRMDRTYIAASTGNAALMASPGRLATLGGR